MLISLTLLEQYNNFINNKHLYVSITVEQFKYINKQYTKAV